MGTLRPARIMAADSLWDRLRFLPESGEIWLDDQRMIMVHTPSAMGELRRELIETHRPRPRPRCAHPHGLWRSGTA